METSEPKFITKGNLLERGWTEALIAKFMSEPDQTKMNPRYRKAAPMKLYLLTRAEQIEASEEYASEKEKTAARRNAAKKAVSTKTATTMKYVDDLEVTLRRMTREHLIGVACRHYNNRQLDRNQWEGELATKDSDQGFIDRICVNYLRHQMTDYEYNLGEVYRKVGKSAAYVAIRKKIFAAIMEAYPWLADECRRQSSSGFGR